MGFKSPDLNRAHEQIQQCIREINNPRNDGWSQMHCKHQLYQLKCLLNDEYPKLPTFVGEQEWEQERIIDILKRQQT